MKNIREIGVIRSKEGDYFTLCYADEVLLEASFLDKLLNRDTKKQVKERIVLTNCGDIVKPDEILEVKFVFEEQDEYFCRKFLEYLSVDARIAMIVSNSKLNDIMIKLLLEENDSKIVLRNLVESQDLFPHKEFVELLNIEYKFILFTENINRSKENMAGYIQMIDDMIVDIVSDNIIEDKKFFGFKEIDLLEEMSEAKVSLYNMSADFFNNSFPFSQCENDVVENLKKKNELKYQDFEEAKYILDSIRNNSTNLDLRNKLIEKYSLILEEKESIYNNSVEKIKDIPHVFKD